MKRIKEHGLGLCLSDIKGVVFWLGLCMFVLVGQADEKKMISAIYKFETPQMEINGDYVRLIVPGCGQLHRIGEPAMPFRTARLVIPSGCMVEKAEVVPLAESTPLEGHWRVEYAGQPHSRPPRGKAAFAPGDNRRIYASDAPYPSLAWRSYRYEDGGIRHRVGAGFPCPI